MNNNIDTLRYRFNSLRAFIENGGYIGARRNWKDSSEYMKELEKKLNDIEAVLTKSDNKTKPINKEKYIQAFVVKLDILERYKMLVKYYNLTFDDIKRELNKDLVEFLDFAEDTFENDELEISGIIGLSCMQNRIRTEYDGDIEEFYREIGLVSACFETGLRISRDMAEIALTLMRYYLQKGLKCHSMQGFNRERYIKQYKIIAYYLKGLQKLGYAKEINYFKNITIPISLVHELSFGVFKVVGFSPYGKSKEEFSREFQNIQKRFVDNTTNIKLNISTYNKLALINSTRYEERHIVFQTLLCIIRDIIING